jgi:ribosomal protein S18 acetylase RimI-like enzyme
VSVAVVRWWREEDLPRVAELSLSLQRMHAVALPERFVEPDLSASQKLFEEQFVDPEGVGFVATVGSHIAGYLLARRVHHDADGFIRGAAALHVHHLVVMDEAQGAGIGTALMHSAIEHANRAGLDTITLQTWRFNDEAGAFFEHLGFEVESMRLSRPSGLAFGDAPDHPAAPPSRP